MKTKSAETIPTAFPTCGEIFHFLIAALDLTAWADAFHNDSTKKRRDQSEIKAVSDKLRDWATEAEGRVPSREELERFIRDQVKNLPRSGDLTFVLCNAWRNVLDDHADEVRENATYLDRDGTRVWYALTQASRTLYFLWALQKFLRRLSQENGPMLDFPLEALLTRAWPDAGTDTATKHPLHSACYQYYAKLRQGGVSKVDPKTLAAWKSGQDRPSCDALGRHFADSPDKLGLVLSFAFAGLLEAVANTLRAWISPADWPECRRLLLGQANCMRRLDDALAEALADTPVLSLADYGRLLGTSLGKYMELLRLLPQSGEHALDLRVAKFRVYEEYQRLIAERAMPAGFDVFYQNLGHLWTGTALNNPQLRPAEVNAELKRLRAKHPDWCKALAGPLLAIEARLTLCHEPPTQDSLQRTLGLYKEAFDKSRYQAGVYTIRIAREALGLAALMHRRETGEGAIKPWMKKVLTWWDLLELGKEFGHERLEQRIELAESRFTDELSSEVRGRLKLALPQIGLNHWNIGGLAGFTNPGLIEQLRATPVDRRQKKPMSTTIVGRDQTSLMEAIDREQLALARELIRKGADLNFINSTGDTCVTKAFARKDYDLVLEILRRDHEPIRRETLLRVTDKMKITSLEQAISEGKVAILRELALWKPGRGDVIDMNKERVWGQTPLYYAISCLVHFRASSSEAVQLARGFMPGALANNLSVEVVKAAHEHFEKEYNPKGVLECIDYLVNELRVDLDTPNANDNSALTYAAERRMHDVVALLLAARASVNHRFNGGGTALVRAILNDDYEMAKLLLEYCADYRLFVDALGRPIYAMEMSEKVRQLIPQRA